MQKTLRRQVCVHGISLFTGQGVMMTLNPAILGHGIRFERSDLPGAPQIPAKLSYVREAHRTTRLAANEASVGLVEHLLSALSAYGIDHALIQVTGPELPIFDGSALRFIELIEQAGVVDLGVPKEPLRVTEPLFWSEKEIHLIALPSVEFRVSYTLHYPQSAFIGSQYYSCNVLQEHYKMNLAPCRTFALYEEVEALISQGLLKGVGLESGLVIQGEGVLNPEGVRFSDEMVRHKVLDLIGDLSLIGRPIRAHIIAVRSGHASNIAFAKILEAIPQSVKNLEFEQRKHPRGSVIVGDVQAAQIPSF